MDPSAASAASPAFPSLFPSSRTTSSIKQELPASTATPVESLSSMSVSVSMSTSPSLPIRRSGRKRKRNPRWEESWPPEQDLEQLEPDTCPEKEKGESVAQAGDQGLEKELEIGEGVKEERRNLAKGRQKKTKTKAKPKKGDLGDEASSLLFRFHCRHCLRVLSSASGLSKHTKERRCDVWAMAGCAQDHEHQVLPTQSRFPSVEAALQWINAQELDQYFSTRESRDGYVSMTCINSVWTRGKRPPKVTRPGAKPRKSSSKRTELCYAKINISRGLFCTCDKHSLRRTDACQSWEEAYVLRGCLTHTHEIDPRKTRLSHATRGYIVNLLQQGHSVERVVAICEEEKRSISAVNKKPITSRDVANLQMLYVTGRKRNVAAARHNDEVQQQVQHLQLKQQSDQQPLIQHIRVETTTQAGEPVEGVVTAETTQQEQEQEQHHQHSVVLPAEFAADYQAIMAATPANPGEAVVLIGPDGQAYQVDQGTGRHEPITVIHTAPIGTAVPISAAVANVAEETPAPQEPPPEEKEEKKKKRQDSPPTQFDVDKAKLVKRLNEILAFLKSGTDEEEMEAYMNQIRPAVMGAYLPLGVYRGQRARNKAIGEAKKRRRRRRKLAIAASQQMEDET